jgi:ubiquinone/menaquinone biosynthesis C-methylase UbiE
MPLMRTEPERQGLKADEREAFSIDHLQSIRQTELNSALRVFPASGRVLEIGAGAGWQAKALADRGYAVEAIDVAGSTYTDNRIWPVAEYDGGHIPFPSGYFDVVFTSHTLEHIIDLEAFLHEIRRVLKPHGIAVCILPTTSWRIWTSLTHYVFVMKSALVALKLMRSDATAAVIEKTMEKYSGKRIAKKIIIPPRHGERGNAFSEVWYFSRSWWRRHVRAAGWQIESCFPSGLFYTGYSILGARLNIKLRSCLAKTLGSSSMIYVLR